MNLLCLDLAVLSGLGVGGAWGLKEGAMRPLAVSNARLRINSILNSVTRRGSFAGNTAGVIGKVSFGSMLTTVLSTSLFHFFGPN